MFETGGSHLADLIDHISYTPFGAPVAHTGLVDFLFEYDGELYDQDTRLQLDGRR